MMIAARGRPKRESLSDIALEHRRVAPQWRPTACPSQPPPLVPFLHFSRRTPISQPTGGCAGLFGSGPMSWFKSGSKLAVLLFALILAMGMTGDAFARAGFGSSLGSRGVRTFSPPSSTAISPNGSAIQRSVTSPNSGSGRAIRRPADSVRPRPSGRPRRRGLIGLLFGHGFFGGLGGGMSLIGILIQIGLIVLLVRFAMNFFRKPTDGLFRYGIFRRRTRAGRRLSAGHRGAAGHGAEPDIGRLQHL